MLKPLVFLIGLAMVGLLAVACGDDATSTPLPTVTRVAATPTPAAPAMMTSTTDRLVMAGLSLVLETNIPWNTNQAGWDKGQMADWLLAIDQDTGKFVPNLATKWTAGADGKSWTFDLRDGVEFHHGWGKFTGNDVKHSIEMTMAEGAVADDAPTFKATIESIEVPNDRQVIIRQKVVDVFSIPFFNSGSTGATIMSSKAQWDAEGEAGMIAKPAWTGSYQYATRSPGKLEMTRVENHWRQTPEFREFEMNFIKESATRMAMLLADEAHLAVLPKSQQPEAEAQGKRIAKSLVNSQLFNWFWGGLYWATPEHLDCCGPRFPWVGDSEDDENARKVRQAMNKAIDREGLVNEFFKGEAEVGWVYPFHPDLPGWNPRWEAEFDEKYGYDPVRARELLAEAGYPNGFAFDLAVPPSPSIPEQVPVGEAMGQMFEAVGLSPTIVIPTFPAFIEDQRGFRTHGKLYPVPSGYRDPQISIRFFNDWKDGVVHTYDTLTIKANLDGAVSSISEDAREGFLRAIGDEKYDQFAEVPFVFFKASIAFDPKVVQDYKFPGTRREAYSHLEYIKAASTQ